MVDKIIEEDTTPRKMIRAINALADESLAPLQKRFLDGFNSNDVVYNYIISGDSTRDNSFNEMIAYCEKQLAKVKFSVVDNAASGMKASEWLANTRATSLQVAIDATAGTGEHTIHAFSLGINDAALSDVDFKQLIMDCAQAYIAAKPDAILVLVSPTTTQVKTERRDLAYLEVATELNLPLVVGSVATASIYNNGINKFYQDRTHPNKFGSIRAANYNFDAMLPTNLKLRMTLDNDAPQAPPSTALVSTPQVGSYTSFAAAYFPSFTEHRSLAGITVEPNFTLRITHQGNKTLVFFVDSEGQKVATTRTTDVGEAYREVTVPIGAYEARVNISDDGAAYDALNDVPIVEYAPLGSVPFMRQEYINEGLSISMPIVNKFLIDEVGSLGDEHQVPTGVGGGKWLWK